MVVIGSLNMDLVVRVPRLPAAGETIAATQFQMVPGGKGANQAAAASKLGAQVAMMGRVGQDIFGEVLVNGLATQGVDTQYVIRDDTANTGIAVIIVNPSGENRIVIEAGANGRVGRGDVDSFEAYISGSRMLVAQFEIPVSVVDYALEIAGRHGVTTILNAAPAYPVSTEMLKKVDYLVLNETECSFLTGMHVLDASSGRAAARQLLEMGATTVIVTLGEKGAVLTDGSLDIGFDAPHVDVVDTTAAGDAFVGGLAVALLRDFSRQDALHYAVCAGSLAVTKAGAQSSLPSTVQVDELYAMNRSPKSMGQRAS